MPDFTYDQIALQLTQWYWGGTELATRKFAVSPGGSLDVNFSNLNADGQTLAAASLQAWTYVTGINFNAVTGSADITFSDYDFGAYCDSVVANGTISSSHVNISTGWISADGASLDTYSFQTYIHEIGHALGLGHAGDYNGSASYGFDNHYDNDSWQATVMSYFSQYENTSIEASYAYVVTPMIADIIAIQNLYGTNSNQRTGDTIYGENSNAGGYYDILASVTDNCTFTILDDGGIDTIDLHSASEDLLVDLRAEGISNVGGADWEYVDRAWYDHRKR